MVASHQVVIVWTRYAVNMLNKSTFDMQDLCCIINKVKDKNLVSEQLKQRVAAISDAIHLMDKYTINGFNSEELNVMMNHLCTDWSKCIIYIVAVISIIM